MKVPISPIVTYNRWSGPKDGWHLFALAKGEGLEPPWVLTDGFGDRCNRRYANPSIKFLILSQFSWDLPNRIIFTLFCITLLDGRRPTTLFMLCFRKWVIKHTECRIPFRSKLNATMFSRYALLQTIFSSHKRDFILVPARSQHVLSALSGPRCLSFNTALGAIKQKPRKFLVSRGLDIL